MFSIMAMVKFQAEYERTNTRQVCSNHDQDARILQTTPWLLLSIPRTDNSCLRSGREE